MPSLNDDEITTRRREDGERWETLDTDTTDADADDVDADDVDAEDRS